MSQTENDVSPRLIKTFGRLKGRPLSKNQVLGLAMLKEKYGHFFETKKKIWLEIGFGNGFHLIELAKRNCNKLIIGSEVYENGVATTCLSLFQNQIENVRVFHGDARILLDSFETESIDRIYVLFPDPWTKKKHKSRRLFSSSNFEFFSKILKSKGYICIATDVEDYYLQIEDTILKSHQFKKVDGSPKQKNLKFFLDVKTKYEEKAINRGVSPSYLVYKKV